MTKSLTLAVLWATLVAPTLRAADACSAPETGGKASQAMSLVQQKKYAEAEGPAKEALDACPGHADAARALGEALVQQKKYDEAVNRLEAVVKAKDNVAYAFYWLGQAYYNRKQADKMVRNFDRFLQLAPNAPEAPSVQNLLAGLR